MAGNLKEPNRPLGAPPRGPGADIIIGTAPKSKPTDTIMGGLGGTLSTVELIQARKAYNDYVINADTNGSDRLTFEEFVQQVWKKQ